MERDALRILFERHGGHVFARCRYLLRDDDAARDATQDVFLKALDHGDSFRGQAQAGTWLLSIATNHCLNVLRAQRNQTRRAVAEGRIELDAAPKELWSGDRVERRALVRQLLEHVDGEAAQIAVLYFIDELTQDEIGAVVGRSLPTIRKRLREFVAAAASLLGTTDDFPERARTSVDRNGGAR